MYTGVPDSSSPSFCVPFLFCAPQYPQLYIPGIRGESFTFDTFWRWILIALVEAVWATIFPVYALQTVTVRKNTLTHRGL